MLKIGKLAIGWNVWGDFMVWWGNRDYCLYLNQRNRMGLD